MLQVAMPCCLFADGPIGLTLRGGTNADMAPPIDYTVKVLLPTLYKFRINCEYRLKRRQVSKLPTLLEACLCTLVLRYNITFCFRGFFPAGRGEVHFTVHPGKELQPINFTDFGTVEEITGEVYYAGKVTQKVT